MSATSIFKRITAALEQAGVSYMLAGSFASAYYGAPRATQDIDIVIAATEDQVRSLVQLLPKDEYYVELDTALQAHRRQSLFNVVDMATGWKVDFIIRKSRAFSEEEFRRRTKVNLEGIILFVASAEDVIVSKLEGAKLAQSTRQIRAVSGALKIRWGLLDHAYLEKWVHELELTLEWNNARQTANISE